MVTLRPSIQPLTLHPPHATSLNSGDTLPWQCLSHLNLADLLLVLVSSSSYWHMRRICYPRRNTTSLSHPSRTASFLPPASSISFHRAPFPSPLSATLLLTNCLGHPPRTACPSTSVPASASSSSSRMIAQKQNPPAQGSTSHLNHKIHGNTARVESSNLTYRIHRFQKKAQRSFFQKKPQDPSLSLRLAKKPRTCKIHGFCTAGESRGELEKPWGFKSNAKGLREPTKPRGLKPCRRKVAGLKKLQEPPECFKNT